MSVLSSRVNRSLELIEKIDFKGDIVDSTKKMLSALVIIIQTQQRQINDLEEQLEKLKRTR